MDSDSIISSALDIYADESTLKNEYGNIKMKPYEKEISFFNNYFVFKKVRSVNAKYVYESFVGKIDEIKDEDIVSIPTIKVKTKKLKKKLTLNG